MILYFANREMQVLGQASMTLPNSFVILDDLKSEDVDTGVATFECKIGFDKENRLKLEEMTNAGNYLLRSDGDENEFYTIIDSEIDTKNQEVYIYAEDAGLDLLNEVVGAFEATESHTAEWYINKYTNDSGFEIGINEIPSTSTRKLSWDGEATATERLASIATQFGGYEISFSFAIKGMEVSNKYINIYKERGKELEELLMLNRDIDRIITKKSVANLATAFLCTGGIPKGKDKPITLEGYEYDDGDFYVSGKYVKSREAVNKWSRYVWNKEPNQQTGYAGHIVRRYTYDTTSQKTLCSHAITELKKICDMEVNYEVDINRLPDTVRIGDRVNIVDDAGELYLSARILKFDKSAVNKSYKATLGEYLIKDSGISQKVEDLAAQFAELAANRTFYTWIAYADDETGAGISLDPAGKEYMGTAANQTSEEVDISDPSIFKWSKIKGEQGPQGEQGIPGTNGSDGKTSYFHIKYSSVSNPTSSSQMTETPSEYIGTYVDYTSTDSTDPSKYTWARFQGLQGETGEQGIPGTNGSDGKTSYLHIKYSNDGGSTFTSNNGETAGDYIGQYVDYTQADSTSVSAYTWSKIKGDAGRGTQNVTRYYILQSSAAAAPSKPTTNPPPSGWTDTEPTYTSGSTNSLYFCDLMVFSDKTWQYSEVSKSSSYEAAKEAYNKAVSALTIAESADMKLASWCAENDDTLIEGSKIYTGSITALQIAADTITAEKLNIPDLNAIGATIGGFTIGNSALYNGTTTLAGADNSVYLGLNGISCGTKFKVDKKGVLSTADIKMEKTYTEDGITSTFGTYISSPDSWTGSGLAVPEIKTETKTVVDGVTHSNRLQMYPFSISLSKYVTNTDDAWLRLEPTKMSMFSYINNNGFKCPELFIQPGGANSASSVTMGQETHQIYSVKWTDDPYDYDDPLANCPYNMYPIKFNASTVTFNSEVDVLSSLYCYDDIIFPNASQVGTNSYPSGRHVLANNTSVSFLNSSGTRVRGIGLGSTDNLLIGDDSGTAGMYGYITAQNNIAFYAGTSHDQCFASIYSDGKRYFQSKPIAQRTTSGGTAVRVNDNGTLFSLSSSSMRYKEEITCQLSEELNPERLYDLNVWQYKYREGHLDKGDQRYGKTHIGLIAEDVKQHYPIAANFNEDGDVEDWSERYLLPPMLKLIQMQHEEIEAIKAELKEIRAS